MGFRTQVVREQGPSTAGGSRGRWRVTVQDDAQAGLEANFWYVLTNQDDWRLTRIAVGAPDATPEDLASNLTASQVRDMPIARWQRAAQVAMLAEYQQMMRRAPKPLAHAARAQSRWAEVRLRLAAVAGAYRANLAAGLRDPVAAIARDYGVKPSTARSWVHRARKAELLGAAMGRTAGEQLESQEDES